MARLKAVQLHTDREVHTLTDQGAQLTALREELKTARWRYSMRARSYAMLTNENKTLRRAQQHAKQREAQAMAAVQAEIKKVREELFMYITERTKLPR